MYSKAGRWNANKFMILKNEDTHSSVIKNIFCSNCLDFIFIFKYTEIYIVIIWNTVPLFNN